MTRTLDLLCHRYGNPAFFIDTALSFGVFSKSLDTMRAQADDERLWDIYLRSDMQQSFADWKAEVVRKAGAKDGMTKRELVVAATNAMDIFKRCKPPE